MVNRYIKASIFLNFLLILALALTLAYKGGDNTRERKSSGAESALNINPTAKNYKDLPQIESYTGLPSGLVNNQYPSEICGVTVDEKELQLVGYRINFNYCPDIDKLNYEMITPYQILMAAAGREPLGERMKYWMNARFVGFNVAIDHWDFLNPDPSNTFADRESDISKFYVENQALGNFGCIGPDPEKVLKESNGIFKIHMGQLQVGRWSGKCGPIVDLAERYNLKVEK